MFQTYLLQAARVLGLSLDKIILLDHKTKVLSKCQNTQDLLQVSENMCAISYFFLSNTFKIIYQVWRTIYAHTYILAYRIDIW